MADFLQAIRYETKRETRRHDANFTELEQPTTRSMFSGLMCALYQTGHAESKNPLQENLAPTPQDQRLAQVCRKWLTEDLLAEDDLANHYLLSQNYPVRRRMPGDEPEEPIARRARHTVQDIKEVDTDRLIGTLEPSIGEDLDDEIDKIADTDQDEPTERQKRELLKIHRGLGHPQPNELGRALRNAGVKRNLIRWAVRDMRCPVCESRVKPLARKPSSLPRTLKFNQVVGVDLVEFKEMGLELIMINIVCWGTGFQMMAIIPDKRSATVRDAFSKEWVRHYGCPELVVTDQG